MARRLGGLVSHDQTSIPDDGSPAQRRGRELRLCLRRSDFDHRGQLDKLGLVLIGVVLAEEEFGA
jgi:hypothetical protein